LKYRFPDAVVLSGDANCSSGFSATNQTNTSGSHLTPGSGLDS
jgi:hypothetical protein